MSDYKLTADAVAKLQEALDFITEHQDRHDQALWVSRIEGDPERLTPEKAATCGTSACLAGWLTLFNNAVPADAWRRGGWGLSSGKAWYEVDFSRFNVEEETHRMLGATWYDSATGENWIPGPHADQIREELDVMFEGDRSVEELWYLGQRLAEGRLKVPANVVPASPGSHVCDCHRCV